MDYKQHFEVGLVYEETETSKTAHIDLRYGYIEGVGQLCRECFSKLEKGSVFNV